MNRKHRLILIGAASACFLLALLGLSALYALQTNWFKNKVRERIITAVENASGGRVELDTFSYNWRTLTAEFRGFVVHGTESAGAPPLFQAKSVRIGLKITSVLKRDIDIASLIVERPEIYLLVQPDGTTNIPPPKIRQSASSTAAQLLNLKVRHFEFNHGSMDAEMRRVPLNVRGEDVSMLVSYEPAASGYEAHVSSKDIRFNSAAFRPFAASLDAIAQFQRNRFVIRQLALTSNGSKLQVSGTIQPFARPSVDLRVDGKLDASAIARIADVADVRAGTLVVIGTAHYDESSLWMFQGKIDGRNLSYRSSSLALQNASFESEVLANRAEVKFAHLAVASPDGKFSGQAVLKNFRELQLDGRVSALDIRTAASLLSNRPLPWTGIASGPIHVAANLNRPTSDLTVQSNLEITPARGCIPLSGNADVSYANRGDVLQFGNSHLELPRTQLSFSGLLGSRFQIALDSTNLDDLKPVVPFSNAQKGVLPVCSRTDVLISMAR